MLPERSEETDVTNEIDDRVTWNGDDWPDDRPTWPDLGADDVPPPSRADTLRQVWQPAAATR